MSDNQQEPKQEPSLLDEAVPRPIPNWPFLLYNLDNRWYLNKARRRSAAEVAADQGEARW